MKTRNRTRNALTLAAVALALLAVSPISANAALIADYGTDFSTTANPTPTGWSYLRADTTNGVVTPASASPIIGSSLDRPNLNLLASFTNVAPTAGGFWRTADVAVNAQSDPWNFIQLNATAFHPGSGNTGPVINYTTSAAYTGVTLDYDFTNISGAGDGVELVVFVDDVVTHISAVADGAINENNVDRSVQQKVVDDWLNDDLDYGEVSDDMWHQYTEWHNPYYDAVDFCEVLGPKRCKEMGLEVVESTLPENWGEPIVRLAEDCDYHEVNRRLAAAGYNFVIEA